MLVKTRRYRCDGPSYVAYGSRRMILCFIYQLRFCREATGVERWNLLLIGAVLRRYSSSLLAIGIRWMRIHIQQEEGKVRVNIIVHK